MKLLRYIVICLFVEAPIGVCQDMPVPASTQVPVILKVLSFDRNLRRHAGDKLVLGVVFQGSVHESEEVAADILQAFAKIPDPRVDGLPISVIPIDLTGVDDLQSLLASLHVDALYIAPLHSKPILEISTIARVRSITTFTGIPDYVERGCSVGVTTRGGRMSLLINLAACRAEGSKFDPQLLRLAQTIDEGD